MSLRETLHVDRLVFLDVEASGLGPDSFPIEVGWAFPTGSSGGFLIRPASTWSLEAWDPAAEELHGISHAHLLENGITAWDAALQLNAVVAPQAAPLTVISDARAMDSFWLDRLFAESPIERQFKLHDVSWLRAFLPSDVGSNFVSESGRLHRAEADARCLARLWLALSSTKLLGLLW